MKDFRKRALREEDLRYKREMYLVMEGFIASCATIVVLVLLCYVILISG